jgi:superfamily II DNA or RNA helicase
MSYSVRDYQVQATDAAHQKLCKYNSTLIELATGLGKTVIGSRVIHELPGRALWLAHRDELIRQAAQTICALTGDAVAVEMGREQAEESLYGAKVTVGSIQTLARANRRARFHPDHFALVVVDEAHHATAATYRDVLGYFRSAKKLMLTATPVRADQVGLEHVCESVAFRYSIEPAIDDGWLVPVQQTVVKVDGLDFSRARTVAADFNQGDLERILTDERPLHLMVASAHELIGERQALWFCTSVPHARALAAVLGRYAGVDNVACLAGDTPRDERRWTVSRYKAGAIKHLLNCALFLEGFDCPATSAIVMGRPTKHVGLYLQVLGRGTRPLPGIVDGIEGADERRTAIAMSGKPNMLVIDFAGNAGKHRIVQAADVLGGRHAPPVRDYARQTMEREGSPVDLEAAFARAQAELELLEEEAQRRAKITARASFRTHDVDPFVKQYGGARKRNARPVPEPCSDRMAWFIVYEAQRRGVNGWTFEKAKRLSPRQARRVIGRMQRQGAA